MSAAQLSRIQLTPSDIQTLCSIVRGRVLSYLCDACMRVLGVRRMPNNNVSDHAGMQDNTFTTHLDKSASSLSRLKEGFSNSSRLALPACARLAPRDLFHLEPRDLPSAFLGLTDNNNSNTLRKPRAPSPSRRHEHVRACSLHSRRGTDKLRATSRSACDKFSHPSRVHGTAASVGDWQNRLTGQHG